MFPDTLKADIINQLAAMEGGRIAHNDLEPYFRSFTGAFSADMPFTIYFEAINRPIMFVHDPASIAARSSHYLFMERCEQIKGTILSIAGSIQELADEGYVRVQPPEYRNRPALPADYAKSWRKYKHFYMSEAEGLSFVCLSRFGAEQKLYDVWAKLNPRVMVS
ncbi:hypothetical protein FACS189479_09380 [Spirochaetia bacterium]|nr:hypothetical protein FACS189479_09380 [Spirochaetia bacterium]